MDYLHSQKLKDVLILLLIFRVTSGYCNKQIFVFTFDFHLTNITKEVTIEIFENQRWT